MKRQYLTNEDRLTAGPGQKGFKKDSSWRELITHTAYVSRPIGRLHSIYFNQANITWNINLWSQIVGIKPFMRGRWKWRTVGLCWKHGNGAFEQSLETLICFSLNNIQWALWSALSRCDVICRSVPFHFVDYFHLPGNTAQVRQTLTNLRLGLGVYFGIGLVIIQYADANFEAVIITSFSLPDVIFGATGRWPGLNVAVRAHGGATQPGCGSWPGSLWTGSLNLNLMVH